MQATLMGAKAFTFTGGGEPLVNPDTIPALIEAKKRWLQGDFGFITNGLVLDNSSMMAILKNCVWVRISLDASDAEMYKETHGMPEKSFERVLRNIDKLVNLKKEMKSKCTIGVGYLTRTSTLRGMESFTETMKGLGVDYVQFRPFHGDSTQITEQFQKCQDFATSSFSVLCSSHKYEKIAQGWARPYDVCYGHSFAGVIGADAEVYLCCHMRGMSEFSFGNLREQSLEEIWNSDKRKKVIQSIDLTKCPPMCRCDTFNELLWEIRKPQEHVNFL